MAYTEHSIFGATDLSASGYVTFNDLGVGGWTGSNFYPYTGAPSGLVLIGGRLWIPPGSSATGKSARMGYYVQIPGGGPIHENTGSGPFNVPGDLVEAYQATKGSPITLQAGWNEYRLPTPVPLGSIPDGVSVGWQIDTGGWYMARPGNTFPAGPTFASDGFHIVLSEDSGVGSPRRGQYGNDNGAGAGTGQWAFNGGHYGADIIIGEPNADLPASGSFSSSYTFGPAASAGAAPAAGVFNGTYGWRPASAEGSAKASGVFGSQYGWGAAVATGETKPGGVFAGEYGWRPASSAGERPALGAFSAGYRFGPAIAGGSAPVGGAFTGSYGWGPATFVGPYVPPDFCWPAALHLTAHVPGITLTPKVPSITLTPEEPC